MVIFSVSVNKIYAVSDSIDPNIFSQFEKARDLLSANDYVKYSKGNDILNNLEKKLISEKNYDQLLYLYLEISYFHITQCDYNSAKHVLDKVGKTLDEYPNNKLRGEYYEHLAVYYNAQDNKRLDEKYTLLSEKYLSKYGSKAKQVDMLYNMTLLYLNRENWPKTLEYSNNYIKTNEEVGGGKTNKKKLKSRYQNL